jgi:poly-gamma-glutamate system protein
MGNTNFKNVIILTLSLVSLIFYGAYYGLERHYSKSHLIDKVELKAAELMSEAEKIIFRCQQEKGLRPEQNIFDPNHTGLIGLEYSPLTTTLGNLEAKRTTTNPNIAALAVHLLGQAGVKGGDVVAVGASCSFPALILASYCAARSMGVTLLVINSVGASQWGANNPEFTWLEIEECLRAAGFTEHRLLAISWGGEDDSGKNFPEGLRIGIEEKATSLGIGILEGQELEKKVRERLQLYFQAAGEKKIRAFINIGGSYVNLGTDSSVLEVKPGLTRIKKIPPASRRGVIQETARREIPVIHLLHIRGLVEHYGLPWDPQPLPEPGETIYWKGNLLGKKALIILFSAYIFVCGLSGFLLIFIHKKRGQQVL